MGGIVGFSDALYGLMCDMGDAILYGTDGPPDERAGFAKLMASPGTQVLESIMPGGPGSLRWAEPPTIRYIGNHCTYCGKRFDGYNCPSCGAGAE